MADMKSDLFDVLVEKLRETRDAVLVTDSIPENAVWLAKSQIEIERADTPGLFVVTMPEWLAIEKGFV